jgi:hypothetical protein
MEYLTRYFEHRDVEGNAKVYLPIYLILEPG